MNINRTIKSIPSHARLWFYNVPKKLSEDEVLIFEGLRKQFLDSWNTHGRANEGDVWLIENQLIVVVGWNEFEPISGCSIDKSVAFIRSLSERFQVDLMDRMWVYFQRNSAWESAKIHQFWALRKANEIGDDTLVLDTTITEFSQMDNLSKTFASSWHAQMWK
ncbi:MAG: hypothetical protein RL062_1426 [Bacteroidota bacterium]|jgi:hypothetical protein